MNNSIKVVAGVISNPQEQILISKRHPNSHQGGLWEFPGGKIEAGENSYQALQRELKEELDIQINQAEPLIRINHQYPEKKILLDVWKITNWQGQAKGCEGQPINWCNLAELKNRKFPAANYPIIKALQLPEQYLITPDIETPEFIPTIKKCLDKGIKLIQLRAKNPQTAKYQQTAEQILKLSTAYQAKLLLNADLELVKTLGADGQHLNNQRLHAHQHRILDPNKLISAACHNQADINQAQKIDADIILISPISPTKSHPQAATLGWQQFFKLSEQANCPSYALGGMLPKQINIAKAHGGQGIAAITGIWKT